MLFAIFGRGGSDAGVDDRQIVVSEADIDRLAAGFSRTWHRPPAADELEAQIQDYIREEVLYRTALALGLDKDDTIIRRRLRQKMEFSVRGHGAAAARGRAARLSPGPSRRSFAPSR